MKFEGGRLKGERKSECCGSNFALLSSHFLTAIKKNVEELSK